MTIPTFWKNRERPTTRYALLFGLYTDQGYKCYGKSVHQGITVTPLSSMTDVENEISGLEELYQDHPLPVLVSPGKNEWDPPVYNFDGDRSWWGYAVLDFEKSKIIRLGGPNGFLTPSKVDGTDQFYSLTRCCRPILKKLKDANSEKLRDFFFRDTSVCPDSYDFDGEWEYSGWLQFKWGDGRNSISRQESGKKRLPKLVIDNDDTEI